MVESDTFNTVLLASGVKGNRGSSSYILMRSSHCLNLEWSFIGMFLDQQLKWCITKPLMDQWYW